ncbi:MAG: class II aldolase/adducin family protein [Bacteroidales bacterium]|nr:class II aldolase/adducin family protein [Bacteroidales bacterium]MDD2424539.1 class II aldolase/adducin family protein [Bacteroidales bacterium]MDD3988479.1 class II aldolase/adducin family protein [Bacteroidales bacterium]MDD4639164.1 class II aldolase/adducin family protein [Bacteroidales bacterium]
MREPVPDYDIAATEICYYSSLLWQKGFADGNGGNLSVKLADGHFLVTPSNFSKMGLGEEQLLLADETGKQLNNFDYKISSEFSTHLAIYRRDPAIKAVIHSHPPYTLSFACTDFFPLEPLTPEAFIWAGDISVIPFLLPGSKDLSDYIGSVNSSLDVLVLKNHGAITSGSSLKEAWFRCEVLESQSKLYHLAGCRGDALNFLNNIDKERLKEIKNKFFK